nr:hypothetical protein [Tanacetum cinerariifolium]
MGDKHFNTIPETGSDELIKSSVENLVRIPSEYEVTFDNESECDVPVNDESSFDYLEEFSGELVPTSIINEERIKREHEEYISLMEKLLTINSCPRPLENFHANTIIETLPISPIPIEDSDSLREEIDIFTGTDDLMPRGIKSDDYDSKGIFIFLKNYLAMIPFLFSKMCHRTLIIMMIRHFLVLLRNHQILRFSLILSPIQEN